MSSIKNQVFLINKAFNQSCINLVFAPTKLQRGLLFLTGVILIASVGAENAYAGSGTFGNACSKMLLLVEGAFGALVAAVAGVAAILAAALGGFKMAWSLVVVSIGAFILRSWIQLFQGTCG
jgi:hypothetical protein